ncbi:unnamed protein product [Phaedon cochleariae]|uniref:G-protein coupled receptors family 1 profile domain-containing protein n=1 Tax=Phaedon cochleariae TaxID=80249 RepID=A0A9N9X515_PHACE|nr:unnamed protein product [Phaedon cochleariae]
MLPQASSNRVFRSEAVYFVCKLDRSSQYSRSSCSDFDHLGTTSNGGRAAVYETPRDRDLDLAKEMRTQKFLVAVVTAFGLCLCPLMILRLARLALIETYDNSGHFDVTYAIFVWIAFAPTCATPMMFAAWQMSGSRMDRLRGYFRFSDRKSRRHSSDTVTTTATGTPALAARPPPRRLPRDLPPPEEGGASDSYGSPHETSPT